MSIYDAASNTLYRYTPPARRRRRDTRRHRSHHHEVPTVAKIEEAISHLRKHANVSGATPTDVAGQPAYTVRVSPKEGGSLFGGAELSWDAVHGVPLRAAIYSSTSSSPVIELAATEISYGPVADSVFEFTPPAGRQDRRSHALARAAQPARRRSSTDTSSADKPKLTTHGHGVTAIAVLESKSQGGRQHERQRTARRAAEGQDQRHQRHRAAHRARHAAQLRALRRALPARRLGHARGGRGSSREASSVTSSEAAAGQGARAGQALQGGPRGRPHRPERPRRRRLRLPRSERRRQDDHAAHGARPDHAHRGHRRAVRARPDARGRARPGGRRRVRRGAALLPLPHAAARTSNCSPRSTATARRSASTRCSRSSS